MADQTEGHTQIVPNNKKNRFLISIIIILIITTFLLITLSTPLRSIFRPLRIRFAEYIESIFEPSKAKDDQYVIKRFHELFHPRCFPSSRNPAPPQWLGVMAMQSPIDAWIHQEIITEVKPDFIVETGTNHGGSAALWATVLQQVNPEGRVITIDINDFAQAARNVPIVRDKVDFLLGSSIDPKILDEVRRRVEGKKVMVILDSAHGKDHVLAEMRAYGPLVNVGSYMIVQDTDFNGHPVEVWSGPGPYEAVEEFLAKNDQFAPDRSREGKFLITEHPSGYLKRVK